MYWSLVVQCELLLRKYQHQALEVTGKFVVTALTAAEEWTDY